MAQAPPDFNGVFVSHREHVAAPPSVVWGLLLEKIRHPEKFVPGVTDVEVVRELGSRHAIERKMVAGGTTRIHEIIAADPVTMTVTFRHHASNPIFSGFVTNTVLPAGAEEVGPAASAEGAEEPQQCILDFTMNWYAKPAAPAEVVRGASENMPHAIRGAVQATKKAAEDLVAAVAKP